MSNTKISFGLASLLLVSAPALAANPVKTVAWNGHQGAVSFTFDDARPSQLTATLPQLASRGMKATFNVYKNTDFTNNLTTWIKAAQSGHEIANHTTNHGYLTNFSDSASVATDVATHANYLRSLDPSIQAVTLAYPYCATNATVDKGVSSQNFIARTCGGTAQFSWGSQPANWMEMTSYIMQPGTAAGALTQLDNAKTNNTWFVVLTHSVLDVSSDSYNITPAQQNAALDRAVTNKLWIDTYQNVAAYYRASFTMDAVQAQTTASGWKMTWTSPHPRMPKSVPLRVTLDAATFGSGFTVSQNSKVIAKESDGSYIVEFMTLSLDITKAGSSSSTVSSSATVSSSSVKFSSSSLAVSSSNGAISSSAAKTSSSSIALSSSSAATQILTETSWLTSAVQYRVYDLFGRLYAQGNSLPHTFPVGMWLVKAFDAKGLTLHSWSVQQK